MKKLILLGGLFLILLTPTVLLASPGSLDQYGGHICQDNCFAYGMTEGQYHYHDIVDDPGYLSGSMAKPIVDYLYYQPTIDITQLISTPVTLKDSNLSENPALDYSYCQGEIFAPGLYDENDKARVKPVCAQAQGMVIADPEITPAQYYRELPADSGIITRVYHYEINSSGKKVYTDRPHINQLSGMLIQGETDTVLYYIYEKDYNLKLRPVTVEKAISVFGNDYENDIVYFDDSIIYSYQIGTILN